MNKNNPHPSRIAQEQRTVAQMIRLYCRKKEGNRELCPQCRELLHTCACPAVRSAKRRTLADSAPFIATSPK